MFRGKNMNSEILEFIELNDVKLIKLAFCDTLGTQKNISIMASELESAFSDGIPFDARAIPTFNDINCSDLLLCPDSSTLTLLPWRSNENSVLRFYCDIKNTDQTPFEKDARSILKNTVNKFKNKGFNCKIGTECEFYLFKIDENDNYTQTPIDRGGYFDIPPLDKGEKIRREISLTLDQMGLNPETSHHEEGPGQNEIDFKFTDALSSADNFLTFKSVVKSVALFNGYFASFMPKPLSKESGSGMHINLSVYKDGFNVFADENSDNYKYAKSFIAGILEKISEITIFLNPINNSYERLGEFKAPSFVSWSHQNRSQLVRIPYASEAKSRIELRSPDSSVNPYLAFAIIIEAGMYGIENNLQLQEERNENLFENKNSTKDLNKIPSNLLEAIKNAENSEFVKSVVGSALLEKYIESKKEEWNEFENAGNKEQYYRDMYFESL